MAFVFRCNLQIWPPRLPLKEPKLNYHPRSPPLPASYVAVVSPSLSRSLPLCSPSLAQSLPLATSVILSLSLSHYLIPTLYTILSFSLPHPRALYISLSHHPLWRAFFSSSRPPANTRTCTRPHERKSCVNLFCAVDG